MTTRVVDVDSDEDVRQAVLANARRHLPHYEARAPIPRQPSLELPPFDFEAAERAWRKSVRRHGVVQTNIYTTNATTGRRCELPIDACMCMACVSTRVLG